jgi:hypothetical protein
LALAALAATAQEPCPEVGPLANADGTARVVCPCFASGEEAGAVFRAPAEDYPLEVLRVGFAWSSQFGGSPQSLESAVRVYAGALPSPGAPIFELEGPVLTDGFINEFDLEPLPGEIAIESRPFLVALKFFNENAGDIFAPSVVHDGNGCRAGRNAVFAIPGGWRDACSLGVTGDWLIQVVYRPFGCGPGEERFIRADDNGDGGVDISDAVFGLDVLFLGGTALCLEAMDSNGDEQHDLSDAVYTLNFLFSGGPPPLAPFPGCGSDAGETDLGCQTPPEACA